MFIRKEICYKLLENNNLLCKGGIIMRKSNYRYKNIDINSIVVWKLNPRHEAVNDEKEAIKYLFEKVGTTYMNNLAKDILNNGLSPYDLPILVEIQGNRGKYYAYEGNRRIAVMKSILNPELLKFDDVLYERYKKNNIDYSNEIEKKIFAVIMDHDSAIDEIEKIHGGEQNGVGRKKWGKFEKDMFYATFRNKPSITVNIVNCISNNLNKNILDRMDPSNVERIFSNKHIKELFKTDDYSNLSENDISILDKTIEKAIEKESKEKKGISRIFNTQESISNFFGPVIKEIQSLDKTNEYNIRATKNLSIKQNDIFNLSMLNIIIYKNNDIIEVEDNDLNIEYYDPKFKKVEQLDTKIIGTWNIVITYKNAVIRINVNINEVFSPEIVLKKDYIEIKKHETINLVNNIKEAKDFLKKDVKNKVEIISIGEKKAKISKNIFLNENEEGQYSVKYEFSDGNGPSISKVLIIDVVDKKETLKAKQIPSNHILDIESTYNTEINISSTINRLINQLGKLDVNKFDCVIATSLRALLELCVDELISKKHLEVDYKNSGKKDKLLIKTDCIVQELEKNIQLICEIDITKLSYHTVNNFLKELNVESLLSNLNLGAHKSTKVLMTKDLVELANKKLAFLLVLMHFYLKV
ncbi:hypothetical protein [Clostridium haemolyticum]|uniref:ParB/Sulfiredoxin domain-containing protein n=1 Tax=Clostridium haemolyticum NCTC 9693 TaxID=1443114 RepID=A0ABR4TDV9_CLOHA|nr:hypothetical protein [Clostridium haemolyticum]KEI15469.1 hypothetical protein Z960_00605 [Clostridium haemolyticum NCTC 9693]